MIECISYLKKLSLRNCRSTYLSLKGFLLDWNMQSLKSKFTSSQATTGLRATVVEAHSNGYRLKKSRAPIASNMAAATFSNFPPGPDNLDWSLHGLGTFHRGDMSPSIPGFDTLTFFEDWNRDDCSDSEVARVVQKSPDPSAGHAGTDIDAG